MSLENLKNIIHLECKYNFIFTNFEYCFTSTQLFGNNVIEEDLYSCSLFLSPHFLCEVGIGFKTQEKTWNLELIRKKRVSLPAPDSYEAKKGKNPSDWEIENDFSATLKNFTSIDFLREPTIPEMLDVLEKSFELLLKKYDISYIKGDFSDKLMEQINKEFDFNKTDVKSMMFEGKEKGVFYKKMQNKLIPKNKDIKTKKI